MPIVEGATFMQKTYRSRWGHDPTVNYVAREGYLHEIRASEPFTLTLSHYQFASDRDHRIVFDPPMPVRGYMFWTIMQTSIPAEGVYSEYDEEYTGPNPNQIFRVNGIGCRIVCALLVPAR